jgi:hypothetical protein
MGDSIKISELNIDTTKFEILTTDTVVVSATKPAKVEVSKDEVEVETTEEEA